MPETRKSAAGNLLPGAGTLRRMVLVEWRDACYVEDYETEGAAYPYLTIWLVGFVLREDEDGIVIGATQADNKNDNRLRSVVSVPRQNIIEVWDLPDPRPAKEPGCPS